MPAGQSNPEAIYSRQINWPRRFHVTSKCPARGVFTSLFCYGLYRYFDRRRFDSLLPPGPKKLPVIDNLLDILNGNDCITYAKWGKDYDTDILHARAAGADIVVINSVEIANDLLNKRSAIYSSRPRLPMMSELMRWDWALTLMPYGQAWKDGRRLFQKHVHPQNKITYQTKQMEYVYNMLRLFLDTPEDFANHIRHMVGGITLSLAYGITILPTNDPLIQLVEKWMAPVLVAANPGTFLVDFIPALKYIPDFFPGAGFKRHAREVGVMSKDFRQKPFALAQKAISSGIAPPSFISVCLDEAERLPDAEKSLDVIINTAGIFFAAGADTTVAAIQTFLLAMILHPEIQAKAQRELDNVCKGQLPEYNMEDQLPYLGALVKEVMRWRPVTPLAIPHSLEKADFYNGYHIPEGAIVIPNAWAMLHNEANYPNPEKFDPERFLVNGKLNLNVRDPTTIAFGFGRRICPGSHIAMSTLWMTAATILSTFNVKKALDANGIEIEPPAEYQTNAAISHPLPFPCLIKPRSKAAVSLIESAFEQPINAI